MQQPPDAGAISARLAILLLVVMALAAVGWRTLAMEPASADPNPPPEVTATTASVVPTVAATIATPTTATTATAESETEPTSASSARSSASDPMSATVSITVTEAISDSLPEAEADLNPLHRTTNILLLGSDRRPRDVNWRTDVIMIVALDMERGEAGVISIPRDLFIDEIEDHLPNKVNVIDYLGEQDDPGGGGPSLLAKILGERMDLPIDYYLRFEFEGFKQVVDALGGVEIQVDCPVYDFLQEEAIALNLTAGVHRLNGSQALSYVRTRRQGGDLERARRQQRIALAIRDQILAENLLPRIPALYVALRDAVDTDIGLVDAIRFARFALQLTEDEVHGMILSPPDAMFSGWRRGMSVFVPDWPVITEMVQTIFDRPPFIETNTVGPTGDVQTCR